MDCQKCGRAASSSFKAEGNGHTEEAWLCDIHDKEVWTAVHNVVQPFGSVPGVSLMNIDDEQWKTRMADLLDQMAPVMERLESSKQRVVDHPELFGGFEPPTQQPE
jgi:hypothetical protein